VDIYVVLNGLYFLSTGHQEPITTNFSDLLYNEFQVQGEWYTQSTNHSFT